MTVCLFRLNISSYFFNHRLYPLDILPIPQYLLLNSHLQNWKQCAEVVWPMWRELFLSGLDTLAIEYWQWLYFLLDLEGIEKCCSQDSDFSWSAGNGVPGCMSGSTQGDYDTMEFLWKSLPSINSKNYLLCKIKVHCFPFSNGWNYSNPCKGWAVCRREWSSTRSDWEIVGTSLKWLPD